MYAWAEVDVHGDAAYAEMPNGPKGKPANMPLKFDRKGSSGDPGAKLRSHLHLKSRSTGASLLYRRCGGEPCTTGKILTDCPSEQFHRGSHSAGSCARPELPCYLVRQDKLGPSCVNCKRIAWESNAQLRPEDKCLTGRLPSKRQYCHAASLCTGTVHCMPSMVGEEANAPPAAQLLWIEFVQG